MRRHQQFLLLAILFMGTDKFWAIAFAGGSISGGGELFTDAQNPWFVRNTQEIHYCIEIDTKNFGQTATVARNKISAALAYWQREFSSVRYPPQIGFPRIDVRLATQKYVEVSCQSSSVDLVFQMGTLTTEQASFLKHPEKVVANAVRTDYDPILLKGRGYIYVSPETGPHALSGPGGKYNGAIMPGRWRYADGALLELILVHELGHVFGLQHRENTLMAADFPSRMVSYPEAYAITPTTGVPCFLMRDSDVFASSYRYDLGPEAPDPSNDTTKILELDDDVRGLIELRPGPADSLILYGFNIDGELTRRIGSFRKDGYDNANFSELITLYLTNEQKVFPLNVPASGSSYSLAYVTGKERSLSYQPAKGGPTRSIAIHVEGPLVTFEGVNDRGRINLNFLEMGNWVLDWARVPDRDPAGNTTFSVSKRRSRHTH